MAGNRESSKSTLFYFIFNMIYAFSMKRFRQRFYVVLDNIRSTLNVGAIFRTSDAALIDKIFLCGYTPTPEQEKVIKTSLGAEKTVVWEKKGQAWKVLEDLRKQGFQIVALEKNNESIDYRKFKPRFPLVLVVGNEVKGVSKAILKRADKIVSLPMLGKKESLNVSVAFGIGAYKINEFRK